MEVAAKRLNISAGERPKTFITGAWLKWVAMITMFIDHFAASGLYFYVLAQVNYFNSPWLIAHIEDGYYFLRFIGRIAFPIFCFLLVVGFTHTRSVKKYMTRLFLLAFISEVPFDLAFANAFWDNKYQNVFFTLGIGLLAVWILSQDRFTKHRYGYIPGIIITIFFAAFAEIFSSDYGAWGVSLIVVFWLLYQRPLIQSSVGALMSIWEGGSVLISYLLIYLYNGQKGKANGKIFYFFYPLHLIIYIIWRGFLSGQIGPWQFPH